VATDVFPKAKQFRGCAVHPEQAGRMYAAGLLEQGLGLAKPFGQLGEDIQGNP
jgi:hypothetical protein